MNRQSNISSVGSVYSQNEQMPVTPVLQQHEEEESGSEGGGDRDDERRGSEATSLAPSVWINNQDGGKFNSSSLGTVSSDEALLPALEVEEKRTSSLKSSLHITPPNSKTPSLTNISIKSTNSPMTPPQRSPLRIRPILLPSSTSSNSNTPLSNSFSTQSLQSPSSSPFPLPSPSSGGGGPGYELISLEEARARVAASRKQPSSPDSNKLGAFEATHGLKSKKSGFFRRIVGDEVSSDSSPSLSSSSSTSTSSRTISAPIPNATNSFPTTNRVSPVLNRNLPPSPTSLSNSTNSSLRSKTMSFFSNSPSSSTTSNSNSSSLGLNNPNNLPPSLSLKRISETFAGDLNPNWLGEGFKPTLPVDTTKPAISILPVPTSDLFGRWSIFDSIDDTVILNHNLNYKSNTTSTTSTTTTTNINNSNTTNSNFVFTEFISTKNKIKSSDSNNNLKSSNNNLKVVGQSYLKSSFSTNNINGGVIEVIEHCLSDCECTNCSTPSSSSSIPTIKMISRGRFKGNGGKGAMFGSKVIKETFRN